MRRNLKSDFTDQGAEGEESRSIQISQNNWLAFDNNYSIAEPPAQPLNEYAWSRAEIALRLWRRMSHCPISWMQTGIVLSEQGRTLLISAERWVESGTGNTCKFTTRRWRRNGERKRKPFLSSPLCISLPCNRPRDLVLFPSFIPRWIAE